MKTRRHCLYIRLLLKLWDLPHRSTFLNVVRVASLLEMVEKRQYLDRVRLIEYVLLHLNLESLRELRYLLGLIFRRCIDETVRAVIDCFIDFFQILHSLERSARYLLSITPQFLSLVSVFIRWFFGSATFSIPILSTARRKPILCIQLLLLYIFLLTNICLQTWLKVQLISIPF